MRQCLRSRLAVLALLTTALALAAGTAAQARPSDDTIKIGSITILTGPSAQIGIETARGGEWSAVQVQRVLQRLG